MSDPRPKKEPRPRASQISDWLGFIRPHVDEYGSRPRGAQKQFLADLSAKTGSSENTLQRYIAAARILAAHGVHEIPQGCRFLPVVSVEVLERIGKHYPERGRELLKKVLEGQWTSDDLKREWARLSKMREAGRSTETPREQGVAEKATLDKSALATALRVPSDDLSVSPYGEGPSNDGPDLFSKTAYPTISIVLKDDTRIVVFDENNVMWATGHAAAAREFFRNIAIATATFDFVVIVGERLKSEVDALAQRLVTGGRIIAQRRKRGRSICVFPAAHTLSIDEEKRLARITI